MTTQGRARSGYSAWRLIAEELRREIVTGSRAPGTKLPAEGELAERFGVHRNTVRQAVAALAAEHLVVSRRGSGTFGAQHTALGHRIGARTRVRDRTGRRGRASPTGGARPAPAAEAADLGLSVGSVVLVTRSLDTLTDGTPLQVGVTRFAADYVELDLAHADFEWDEPA